MSCPHCHSRQTQKLGRTTNLGYAVFRCGRCQRKFNERTGTGFHFLEFPTDIVFQVVLCRLRYKLSLRDLAELFLLRGFSFTHEAVRDWEERFAPLLAEQLRRKRKGKPGREWYVDETYLKVKGKCCYLYRAIDQDGNLVDSLLSQKRDMAAAQRFFRSALSMAARRPERVTTDGLDSYPRAIKEVLGSKVEHRDNWFLNRHIERDHRSMKQRYYPMRGFSAFASAQRFWRAFEEVRQYLRPRQKQKVFISLAERRTQFVTRVEVLAGMFQAA
jgi:putative transposase